MIASGSAAPEIVFTFQRTHDAVAGERRLIEGGVAVRVMSLPSSLGAGCGLCLRVDAADGNRAQALFAAAEIEPEGVYRREVEEGRSVYRVVSF